MLIIPRHAVLEECDLKRLGHPRESQDLSPCDSYFFSHLRDKVELGSSKTLEGLELAITDTMGQIPKSISSFGFRA
jgi:hypothetical protein